MKEQQKLPRQKSQQTQGAKQKTKNYWAKHKTQQKPGSTKTTTNSQQVQTKRKNDRQQKTHQKQNNSTIKAIPGIPDPFIE
jgi:hypothetical protein